MDLFGSGLSNGAIGAPAWPELPADARAALTSLMTQLTRLAIDRDTVSKGVGASPRIGLKVSGTNRDRGRRALSRMPGSRR
jgi:hypothetical protein